jgi:trehalose-6-phosphate synthase
LYAVSDICLVTSIRDGMNLVSYEYVACQQGCGGVLILSKTTGAAETLRGSLLVNPTDVDEVAQTIERALCMDEEERKQRQQTSLKEVRRQTRYVCHLGCLRRCWWTTNRDIVLLGARVSQSAYAKQSRYIFQLRE